MQYVRIFSDAQGASHFEDVALPALASRAHDGAELTEPIPATGLIFRHVGAAATPVRHVAPRRQFVVHVEGEVEVEVSDGEVRRFSPGSVVLLEDTEGQGHITRPVGGSSRTTLFITLDGGAIPRSG
jgi:hypothetical protein